MKPIHDSFETAQKTLDFLDLGKMGDTIASRS
jgi:hypothetical protein